MPVDIIGLFVSPAVLDAVSRTEESFRLKIERREKWREKKVYRDGICEFCAQPTMHFWSASERSTENIFRHENWPENRPKKVGLFST